MKKFRAWDKKNKKIIFNPIINDIDSATNYIGLNDLFEKYFKKDFILMQSTGLLDKNDKEIYEGDVVRIKLNNHFFNLCVEYVKYGYLPFRSIDEKFAIGDIDNKECEIIGNIHKNRNLLD